MAMKGTTMNMTIDGKQVEIFEDDNNLVEVADRASIGVVAPCFRAKRKNGCCKACVVEVDGEQKYACATKPEDGMNVILNREDLAQIRKERLHAYKEAKNDPLNSGCDCTGSSDCSTGESDCSAGGGCCS